MRERVRAKDGGGGEERDRGNTGYIYTKILIQLQSLQ